MRCDERIRTRSTDSAGYTSARLSWRRSWVQRTYVCWGYLATERYNLLGQILIPLKKEKEELDDLSTELELADEDEKIQYRLSPRLAL